MVCLYVTSSHQTHHVPSGLVNVSLFSYLDRHFPLDTSNIPSTIQRSDTSSSITKNDGVVPIVKTQSEVQEKFQKERSQILEQFVVPITLPYLPRHIHSYK